MYVAAGNPLDQPLVSSGSSSLPGCSSFGRPTQRRASRDTRRQRSKLASMASVSALYRSSESDRSPIQAGGSVDREKGAVPPMSDRLEPAPADEGQHLTFELRQLTLRFLQHLVLLFN